MSEQLTAIRNIGPATAKAFRAAGIRSADELRALGTDAAYRRLLATGHRPHFIAYYVVEMGLQGRPWNDCKGAEKKALRARFDEIVATTRPDPAAEIERVLNQIGVVDRRR